MKKLEKVLPKGKLGILTYLSDRGGVGYIRTILPNTILGSWRHKQMQFDPVYLSHFVPDYKFYKAFSFVKFQRSATKDQLNIFKHFDRHIRNQTNTPLVYEIDDLLFDIPESNFASGYYKQNEPYTKEMLRMSNGLTVSTPALKKQYIQYNKNISIVPNRLAKCLWGEVSPCDIKERKKPRILYPGSQNHFGIKGKTESGGDFGKVLLDFINKTTDIYEWIFVGGIPEEIDKEKITYYDWVGYMWYPSFMKSLDIDIAIAPLEHNVFNQCKSNLKMLEYIICGFPAVYTDIDPYEKSCYTAKTEEEFINKIEVLCNNPDKRKNVWQNDYKRLKNDLYIEDNLFNWVNEHLKLFNKTL